MQGGNDFRYAAEQAILTILNHNGLFNFQPHLMFIHATIYLHIHTSDH